MAGEDLHVVLQLEQPVQAVEEPLGALARLDGEVRPRDRAAEQRVARQQEVGGEKAAVLGPVPGRVQAAQGDRPHAQLVAVRERLVGIPGLRSSVDGHRDPALECEPAVPGHVVGVRVGLQHPRDPDAGPLRLLEVLLDRVGGVDEQRLARVGVADEVRGAPEILVDELPEEHRRPS